MKIFVTLGTQDKEFRRLIDETKKIKGANEIVIQSGYTKCDNTFYHQEYFEDDIFIDYIKKADIIITHGGVGSIIQALNYKKKILAVPRLAKYHEHANDHQIQIVKEFEKESYLLGLYENDDINEKIEALKDFCPKDYISNKENFIKKMSDYIASI